MIFTKKRRKTHIEENVTTGYDAEDIGKPSHESPVLIESDNSEDENSSRSYFADSNTDCVTDSDIGV